MQVLQRLENRGDRRLRLILDVDPASLL